MEIEYVTVAFGFVVLVVIIHLLVNFDAQAWLAKGLKRGDLYSLVDVASGLRPDGLTPAQAQRLLARGMVRNLAEGSYRATIRGRMALRLRQAIRRPETAQDGGAAPTGSPKAARRRLPR